MKKLDLFFLIVILFTHYNSVFSNNFIQKSDLQNGLSSNYIRTIYKDSKGLLWIGTDNGLDSYDGLQFVSYGKRLKMPLKGIVQSILEIKDGTYYIGTTWGAYIYTVTGNKISPIDFGSQALDVRQVFKDSAGKIFFITDKGLFLLGKDNQASLFATQLKTPQLIGMTEDDKHNLWIISHDDITLIDTHKLIKPISINASLSEPKNKSVLPV